MRLTQQSFDLHETYASKWLTYTEKYVEMTKPLCLQRGRLIFRNRLKKAGRIQIVAKVKTQGPNGCFVSYAHSHGMRSVIIAGVAEGGTVL
jgi:hypothetical protein